MIGDAWCPLASFDDSVHCLASDFDSLDTAGRSRCKRGGPGASLAAKERACVVDAVSQTDVVRFVYRRIACLGTLADKTVGELGWGSDAAPA